LFSSKKNDGQFFSSPPTILLKVNLSILFIRPSANLESKTNSSPSVHGDDDEHELPNAYHAAPMSLNLQPVWGGAPGSRMPSLVVPHGPPKFLPQGRGTHARIESYRETIIVLSRERGWWSQNDLDVHTLGEGRPPKNDHGLPIFQPTWQKQRSGFRSCFLYKEISTSETVSSKFYPLYAYLQVPLLTFQIQIIFAATQHLKNQRSSPVSVIGP
jgi:hypothetical protein